jgi:hypothetical protein
MQRYCPHARRARVRGSGEVTRQKPRGREGRVLRRQLTTSSGANLEQPTTRRDDVAGMPRGSRGRIKRRRSYSLGAFPLRRPLPDQACRILINPRNQQAPWSPRSVTRARLTGDDLTVRHADRMVTRNTLGWSGALPVPGDGDGPTQWAARPLTSASPAERQLDMGRIVPVSPAMVPPVAADWSVVAAGVAHPRPG